MTTNPRPISTRFAALLREPLLQFLLLGGLIYAYAQYRADGHDSAARTITIDAAQVRYLENLYEVQFGARPDAITAKRLVENYIDEEILYREALRAGLAEQDEIIRRRMVQKLEFLLRDGQATPVADDEELRKFYAAHAADFLLPAKVSFSHLYFNVDHDPVAAMQRAQQALAALTRDDITTAQSLADRFALNSHYADLDPVNARGIFGQTAFAEQLFSLPTGTWQGPVRSGYGLHLVLIEKRVEPVTPAFESVREAVTAAWSRQARERAYADALRSMRARYAVVRAGAEQP
ncbi:MAG: peptidyl-prolyl cis-trans isomerase [Gammaproteobacteria bacterium]|nr:peptidyl-prolyl cis-trans isomerase [Gammaproteobacteria bacterium]